MNYCQFRNDFIKRMANAGGATPILPPEYQQVEYIASSGTQYLNIGAGKNHQYYLVDFMQLNGVASSSSAITYNLNGLFGINGYIPIGSANDECKTWLRYTTPYEILGTLNNVQIAATTPINLNTRYEFYLSPTKAALDGSDITANTTSPIVTNQDVYIFKVNNAGTSTFSAAVRVYHFQTSSIDLYPCYRKSDNKPGMYDIVNDTFYFNQGTGEFTVGQDV